MARKKSVKPTEPVKPTERAEPVKPLAPPPPIAPAPTLPIPPAPVTKPKKRKIIIKKAPSPIGFVSATPADTDPPTIKKVQVKRHEIAGRSLFLGPKDKVFDTKFNYLGRYDRHNDSINSAYPDSD
jgi:hypothetical protein